MHTHFALSYTWKLAKRAGLVTKTVFIQGTTAAAQMIRFNAGKGLTPDQYTMSQDSVVALARTYVQSGDDVQKNGLEKTVDPALDTVEGLQSGAKTAIDAANADKGTHTVKETGAAYSPAEAYAQVGEDMNVIHGDLASGLTHHKRTPTWLRIAGEVSPFLEIVGLLSWLTRLWNADVLHPTGGGGLIVWVLTLVLVVLSAVAVAFAAKAGGVAHNRAREARAEGNMHAAEPLFTKRNWMLAVCGVLGAIISTTLIIRGLQSLDNPRWYEIAAIVALCLVAGFAMPGLAYAAKATDGSLHSRRADELQAWGAQVAETQTQNEEAAQGLLAQATDLDSTVVHTSLPKVAEDTVAEVYTAVQPYEWAYVQVGATNIELPACPSITAIDPDGKPYIVQSITCGLPGAPALDLQPIKTRMGRIEVLRDQRETLYQELAAIVPVEFAHAS